MLNENYTKGELIPRTTKKPSFSQAPILYGAGEYGVTIAQRLKSKGINALCFCDSNKSGIEPETGLPIISPQNLIEDFDGANIIITSVLYKDEIYESLKRLGVDEQRIIGLKSVKKEFLDYIEICVVNHCNLNCKHCVLFSPIAEPYFMSAEVLKRDLNRMAILTDGILPVIHILGGEPLLHPDLIKILRYAREAFPQPALTRIVIVTNGILLLKQNDAFWDACHENAINIAISHYPINLDYVNIMKLAFLKNVRMRFSFSKVMNMYKWMMDLDGQQDIKAGFNACYMANHCTSLKEGKIYSCSLAPSAFHFNNKFGTNLELTKDDCIDIFGVNDIDEILSFICTPKPFCKYCNVRGTVRNLPWERSKGELSEWT